MYFLIKFATVLRRCSRKLQASLYWSRLTGGHQLSGPITPLSFSVTAFRPRFIHQWSSVLLLLLYRKIKSSLSAIRISPLLRVSATIFTKLLFLFLSLSHRWSSLSMTTYLFFDLFNAKSLFTCLSFCRGHGSCWCVLCTAVSRLTFRW